MVDIKCFVYQSRQFSFRYNRKHVESIVCEARKFKWESASKLAGQDSRYSRNKKKNS